MPTDEHREVIDREYVRATAQDVIDIATPLLREIVNHASMTFRRCAAEIAPTHEESVDLAPLTLYRYEIELVDGIQELVNSVCTVAAIPVLRAAFETCLQLEYLVKDKALFRERSLAWFCGHLRTKIASYKRLDTSYPQGQEFHDSWNSRFDALNLPEDLVRRKRENLENLLESDQLKDIANSFKSSKKSMPHWYSIPNGPDNLRELARELDRAEEYDIWYRRWSGQAHGEDAQAYLVPAGEDRGGFRLIRDPKDLPLVASTAANSLLRATRLMVSHYREGEDLGQWYTREIQSQLRELHQAKIEIQYK
jgi:hypothetical protein